MLTIQGHDLHSHPSKSLFVYIINVLGEENYSFSSCLPLINTNNQFYFECDCDYWQCPYIVVKLNNDKGQVGGQTKILNLQLKQLIRP